MNPRDLKRALKALRERGITPDPAWVMRTRENILRKVRADLAVQEVQSLGFWPSVSNFFPTRVLALARGPVLAVLAVFALMLGGSIASVSAAEKAVPGDLLYPVKLATEQTRLMFASSQGDKLKLKTEFVGRRVEEIKELTTSDSPEKSDRLKQAAEILKRDLDTVKNQLHDATGDASAVELANAAKYLDQKSTELVGVLKDAKVDMPDDVKSKVAEAEAAAVNTGVKAVQVLIESRDRPEVKDVMSDEELLRVVTQRIQGMEDGITDAAHRMGVTTGTSPLRTVVASTSTVENLPVNASSTEAQIKSAQTSIEQTRQMIQDNNLDLLSDKLGDVAKAVATVELNVNTLSAASGTAAALNAVSSTVTGSGSTSTATSTASSTIPTATTTTF